MTTEMTAHPPESLAAFLSRERAVGAGDPRALLAQARELVAETYVHLPDDRAAGVDPLAQLEALERRCPEDRLGFYTALLSVFTWLGDRHTRCVLPEPFASHLAFLPFRVGEYREQGTRHVVVLDSESDALEPGDQIVSWNGLPVEEVLLRQAAWQYGAHPEARHARAVQTLTFRPLNLMPVPDEAAVTLECVSARGTRRTVRLEWSVASFAWFARHFTAMPPLGEGLLARPVDTAHGTFGYLRLASLQGAPETFLADVVQVLEDLPREGLILDLRECEEGFVRLGEQLLQLFTAREITPEPFHFRVTAWSQRLVRSCEALSEWAEPMERAVAAGQTFCEGRPLTSREEANGWGRRYFGPVVLLTSARTYSSAEMFAAGFQDHDIGSVLGTDACTGGGGASPWSQSALSQLSRSEAFRPLPGAPHFRVAVRRCSRVHAKRGVLLEREGVVPQWVHPPTREDLFHADRDLLNAAGRVLSH